MSFRKFHMIKIMSELRIKKRNERDLCSCKVTWAVTNKAQKKFWGSKGIQTHDLCDTSAMLYQLSYEASLEAGQVRVQLIPRGHGFKSHWSLRIVSGLHLKLLKLLLNCENHFHNDIILFICSALIWSLLHTHKIKQSVWLPTSTALFSFSIVRSIRDNCSGVTSLTKEEHIRPLDTRPPPPLMVPGNSIIVNLSSAEWSKA